VTPTSAGPPCGGISVPASFCCNHQLDTGETCDDGGTCSGGSNSDNPCTGNSQCPGGECLAFGGDGCAANCTVEKVVPFVFTGAQCFGGAKNGQACTFIRTCASGALQGKPCALASECGTGVLCSSECATGTDGSDCEGVGICTAGDANKIGTLKCPSSTASTVPPKVVKLCQGGTKAGIPCASSSVCSGGGSCVNPCSPAGSTGLCTHQSGAVLQSVFLGPLSIGPFTGHQELRIGAPDPSTMMMPVSVAATSVHFDPVKIPGLACACPRGVANPAVHGPGNAQSGFIGCGATGLVDTNVNLSIDHNTNPGDPLNGMGTCSGGTRSGLACGQDGDCGGGTCVGTGGGGGVCVAGANPIRIVPGRSATVPTTPPAIARCRTRCPLPAAAARRASRRKRSASLARTLGRRVHKTAIAAILPRPAARRATRKHFTPGCVTARSISAAAAGPPVRERG
jgi:hypothetical protein